MPCRPPHESSCHPELTGSVARFEFLIVMLSRRGPSAVHPPLPSLAPLCISMEGFLLPDVMSMLSFSSLTRAHTHPLMLP